MSVIVLIPPEEELWYGGTVQSLNGMSMVWAKTMLDIESTSAPIQREPFPEYGIISVLLLFTVVLRSAGGASATWHRGSGKGLETFFRPAFLRSVEPGSLNRVGSKNFLEVPSSWSRSSGGLRHAVFRLPKSSSGFAECFFTGMGCSRRMPKM
jgi:hypothetical protein